MQLPHTAGPGVAAGMGGARTHLHQGYLARLDAGVHLLPVDGHLEGARGPQLLAQVPRWSQGVRHGGTVQAPESSARLAARA